MVGIAISSLTLMLFLSIVLQRVFFKYNLIDQINSRSSHQTTASRSGGSALYSVIMIISIYFYINGFTLFDYSILVPISILFFVGLYDDLYSIDFKLKFIFQIIVAKIIIDNGLLIDNLHGVLGFYEINRIVAQIFTIFIIVSIINAINFIDGIDGLAISIISLFIISFEFFSVSDSAFFYLSILTLSSIIPLYIFNFKKTNKIFLGDSGSYTLGGIVSVYVLHILSQDYIIKSEYDIHKIVFIISILSYPITDIIRVFVLRISSGSSPFLADKNHIHHLLNNYLKSHLKTSLIITLISFIIIVALQILLN